MKRREIRHQLISTLLQADGPLTLAEIVARCGAPEKDLRAVLGELVAQGQVVEGQLLAGPPGPQYRWAARWQKEAQARAADSRKELNEAVSLTGTRPAGGLAIDSDPVLAFHDFIINEYIPPKDKRLLVFFQCSVRRPFSTSPSHASMRRAVVAATGYDPAKDFETCPVHVVVLASRIGPVPYELEDVYPANVRSGGVKHFSREHYARVKPILARRMADYITAHRRSYDRITTFTDGRYAEVMEGARTIAAVDFPVLPVGGGPRITRMGRSRPRTYWAKYWIQLYLEIASWLEPAQQAQAQARLREMDVTYGASSGA